MVHKKLFLLLSLLGVRAINADYCRDSYTYRPSSYVSQTTISKEPSSAEKVASFIIVACICAAYGYLAIKYPELFEPRYVKRTVYVPQTVYVPTTEYVRYW